jgi:hypothetical protein
MKIEVGCLGEIIEGFLKELKRNFDWTMLFSHYIIELKGFVNYRSVIFIDYF